MIPLENPVGAEQAACTRSSSTIGEYFASRERWERRSASAPGGFPGPVSLKESEPGIGKAIGYQMYGDPWRGRQYSGR